MARGWLLVIAALTAAPASAQTTHTHCTPFGGELDCTTRSEPQQNLNAYAETREAFARQQAADQAERADYTRRRVGRLIADGRCDDARKAALRGGDLQLAANVAAMCEPAPTR